MKMEYRIGFRLSGRIAILFLLSGLISQSGGQTGISQYQSWLREKFQGGTFRLDDIPTIRSNGDPEIPITVEITSTDTGRSQCDPANDYCHPTGGAELEGEVEVGGGCISRPEFCSYPECAHTARPPLRDYRVADIPYLVDRRERGLTPFVDVIEDCGLVLERQGLRFITVSENCTSVSPRQISTRINIIGEQSGNYTLSFVMNRTTGIFPLDFVRVTGEGPRNEDVGSRPTFEMQLTLNASGNLITTLTPTGVFRAQLFQQQPSLSPNRTVTLQFVQNIILLFIDGEVSHLLRPNAEILGPSQSYLVGFGSENFTGTFRDIRLYNTTVSTSEIYSVYSGLPVARHFDRPECPCPRTYSDSFSFISLSGGFNDNQPGVCHDVTGFSQVINRFEIGRQSSRDNGASSVFKSQGWLSDLTNEAEITITLPQQMLIYSVAGVFGTASVFGAGSFRSLIVRPASMEVTIVRPGGDIEGATSYVSEDCEGEYGMPAYEFSAVFGESSGELSFPGGVARRKRSAIQKEIYPQCFEWKDVLTRPSDLGDFRIPLILPTDGTEGLNDAFSGSQVKIKLIGHTSSVTKERKENWYKLSNLRLTARPHCGGYSFRPIAPPTDISTYYEFAGPDARGYQCQCPPGITGDRCEKCADVEGQFRYTKSEGVCADCACTDLSKQKQCDRDTGQCPCAGSDVDEELAGRTCNWYIEYVDPSYGPKAGGTPITFAGAYFGKGSLTIDINNVRQSISSKGLERTLTTTPYIGFDPENITSDVSFTARLLSEENVGPPTIYESFEYRPNPIIDDIFPRKSIISGGTNITVTGEHMDSVAYPEMIIYLKQRKVLIDEFVTLCDVIDEGKMVCRIDDLTSSLKYITGDKEVEAGGNTESTLPTPSARPPGRNGTTEVSLSLLRRRRQAGDDDEEIDTASALNGRLGVEFTLGFTFDGHDVYRDLRKNPDPEIRELSNLYVYENPIIEEFAEILEYTPGNTIQINGLKLDLATNINDYTVTLGLDGVCEITRLISNRINCNPPNKSPEHFPGSFKNHKGVKTPSLLVEVGKNFAVEVGYVYYKRGIWFDNAAFRISMIVLIVIVGLVLVSVAVYFLCKKFCLKRKENGKTLEDPIDGSGPHARYVKQDSSKDTETLVPLFNNRKLDPDIEAKVNRCRIPKTRLRLGNQLGKGNFGLVFKGQLTTPTGNLRTVAVKSIKEDKEMTFEDLENFLAEGTLMIDFKHDNVLSLVGVVYEGGERPLVVLPYMENGDLCTFVKKDDLDIVLADLLHFAYQVANGMAYLAKERFVHRDLAARNCMVDGSYMVKIADFGMSRDVYSQDYYRMGDMNKPLPMKWMAVESLKEGKYTSKSDVWSYGVTVWELLTRGSSPYPGVNNYYIKEYVSTGKRLDKPEICPPIIYEMMCRCWEHDPDDRPAFSEISEFIGMLLNGKKKPAEGSDEQAGYSYGRQATKNIPDDYLDNADYADQLESSDYYITPIPSTPAPSTPAQTPKQTPKPSPRTSRTAGEKTERVYVNTGPSVA